MKQISSLLIVLIASTFSVNAQTVVFNQDFEQSATVNVKSLQKKKLNSWGDAQWKVTEKENEGFNESNKFVSSDNGKNATLVWNKKLEVGATYKFSVAIKVTNTSKKSWKTNYTIKATSGKKGAIHKYAADENKEAAPNKWTQHEIEFTVIEGHELVNFQVYRFAENIHLYVDNFRIVKK